MTISRQIERRQLFHAAFARMPLWETWTDERTENGKTRMVGHCKAIPRRVRRSMARDLLKRLSTARTSKAA